MSQLSVTELSDATAVERVCAGDLDAFDWLMRRHNRRIFRTVRGILKNDAEAEDAVQDTWIAAYRSLARLESHAAFSSWLTRIAVRRALARLGREALIESLDVLDEMDDPGDTAAPEEALDRKQVARLLEQAIDTLPPSYRLALLLRDVEQMSTAEAAEVLGVSEENLRVRVHRARAALREKMVSEFERAHIDAFPFEGARCDRVVVAVLAAIRAGIARMT